MRSAREQGAHVGAFVERLLGGPVPWIKLRQACSLLRLCQRYGHHRVRALCARALAFEVIDVRRIQGMLKDALLRGRSCRNQADAGADDSGCRRRATARRRASADRPWCYGSCSRDRSCPFRSVRYPRLAIANGW